MIYELILLWILMTAGHLDTVYMYFSGSCIPTNESLYMHDFIYIPFSVWCWAPKLDITNYRCILWMKICPYRLHWHITLVYITYMNLQLELDICPQKLSWSEGCTGSVNNLWILQSSPQINMSEIFVVFKCFYIQNFIWIQPVQMFTLSF
jgi:hypothetical protein